MKKKTHLSGTTLITVAFMSLIIGSALFVFMALYLGTTVGIRAEIEAERASQAR